MAGALVGIAVLLALGLRLMTETGRARAATTGQLRHQIATGQKRISALSGAVSSANQRAGQVGATTASLQSQVNALQGQLTSRQAQLLTLQNQLLVSRRRLEQLEAADARDEGALAQQLVGSYESDQPDVVSVVLESTGFNDLLERLAFAGQIGRHDARIVSQVESDRRAVAAQASQLGGLSVRLQTAGAQLLSQRNSLDGARLALISEEITATHSRSARIQQLARARQSLAALRTQLAKLQAGRTSSSATGGSSPAGEASPSGSRRFVFPLPKSAVAPPSTWSLDDGVDLAAPGGTPEYAVCSGTIVLHGMGGSGPSAPILHCDAPIDGYDYVYYGHAGPGNWTPVGTHVSAGQTISEIGNGIVGISSGPHLEMGFANSSGSPVGPSSAATMMSLLRASY